MCILLKDGHSDANKSSNGGGLIESLDGPQLKSSDLRDGGCNKVLKVEAFLPKKSIMEIPTRRPYLLCRVIGSSVASNLPPS